MLWTRKLLVLNWEWPWPPAPVAGKNEVAWVGASSTQATFHFSPLAWLRQPAPIKIGAGWRSQTIGEIFKGTDAACADPDTRIFPATGHKTAVLPPILIQLTFTSHTAFFGTFLDSKKVPSLLVPLVLFFRDCAAADFVVYYKLVCLVRARAAAITLGMISIGENRYAV